VSAKAAAVSPLVADARRMPLSAADAITATRTGFVGRKRIVAEDPYLAGHFSTLTVYPGVFLIESVHQMLELHLDAALGGIELVGVRSARFLKPALVGDELLFDTTVTGGRSLVRTDTVCADADGNRYARISATWTCRP
jgi:3-hydroxyacyl-[acyl-carrier-protein] dehydratase